MARLFSSIPSAKRSAKTNGLGRRELNEHAKAFLRSNSPPIEPIHRPMSPPLFPRVPSSAKKLPLGDKMEDIRKLIGGGMEVDDDDFDVAKESFALVDGWSKLFLLWWR